MDGPISPYNSSGIWAAVAGALRLHSKAFLSTQIKEPLQRAKDEKPSLDGNISVAELSNVQSAINSTKETEFSVCCAFYFCNFH